MTEETPSKFAFGRTGLPEILGTHTFPDLSPPESKVLADLARAHALLLGIAGALNSDVIRPELAQAVRDFFSHPHADVLKRVSSLPLSERMVETDKGAAVFDKSPDVRKRTAELILQGYNLQGRSKSNLGHMISSEFSELFAGNSPRIYLNYILQNQKRTDSFIIDNLLRDDPSYERIMNSTEIRRRIAALFNSHIYPQLTYSEQRQVDSSWGLHYYQVGKFIPELAQKVDEEFGTLSKNALRYIFFRGRRSRDFLLSNR